MTTAIDNHRGETALATASDFAPAMTIEAAVERFKTVKQFISKIMHAGTDFGVIPGTGDKGKPTLLKPGAEKLCTFFGFRKVPELVEKVEDWSGEHHGGEPFFYYLYRYHLYRGDVLIASADGSCNSWEKKYRWRNSDRRCPQCDKPAIKRSKYPPRDNPDAEPGWYCFGKAGGCGANFDADAPEIVSQATGQVPNPEVCDLVNTIQKMAQKRALVAATLLAVNASDFFTQDMDDDVVDAEFTHAPAPKPAPRPPASNGTPPKSERQILRDALGMALKSLKNAGRYTDAGYAELLSQFGVAKTDELTNEQMKELTLSIEDALKDPSDAWIDGTPDALSERH